MSLKILLADDSMTAQNMGKKILSEGGFEVITVSNGAAALKKVAEHKPDLIILDIYMPGYTGLEVCERVKAAMETSRTPVLLTVGKLEPFRTEDATRVKAEGIIIKPFEATELLNTIEQVLAKNTPVQKPAPVVYEPETQDPTEVGAPAERVQVPQESASAPALTIEDMLAENERGAADEGQVLKGVFDIAALEAQAREQSVAVETPQEQEFDLSSFESPAPPEKAHTAATGHDALNPGEMMVDGAGSVAVVPEPNFEAGSDSPAFLDVMPPGMTGAAVAEPEMFMSEHFEAPDLQEPPASFDPGVEFTANRKVGAIEVPELQELEPTAKKNGEPVEVSLDPSLVTCEEEMNATVPEFTSAAVLEPGSDELASFSGNGEAGHEFAAIVQAAMTTSLAEGNPEFPSSSTADRLWHAEPVSLTAEEETLSLESEMQAALGLAVPEQSKPGEFPEMPGFVEPAEFAAEISDAAPAAQQFDDPDDDLICESHASSQDPASASWGESITHDFEAEPNPVADHGNDSADEQSKFAEAFERVIQRMKPQILAEIMKELRKD